MFAHLFSRSHISCLHLFFLLLWSLSPSKNTFYLHLVCRFAEGAEKYLSLLDTDDDISPFLLRIRSNLCYCYSKVHPPLSLCQCSSFCVTTMLLDLNVFKILAFLFVCDNVQYSNSTIFVAFTMYISVLPSIYKTCWFCKPSTLIQL